MSKELSKVRSQELQVHLKEGEHERLELLLTEDYTCFLATDFSDRLVARRKAVYFVQCESDFNGVLTNI